MKTTKYTNKELVEIYKNLKTSAKILGFSSANDSEMIAEIELEAIKRHLNLIDGTVEETAEMQKEVTKMKEYSVRYLSMKTLTSVCENGKTVKYTYEEAVEKAKELNARADVSYCKIYKGRTLIETVEKTVEETAERQTAEQETVEGISKTETTTEMDDSGFEYTTSQAQEIIMTGTSIAKAEEKKTQFDFYNVTIGFEVEKFIADYESLGIYSDYEKAVQAAQAAADEYGAENIYFRTVEIATRNDRDIYDREDYEFFAEERETIRYNWYPFTIRDTGKREHVNLNNPVRISFTESIIDYNATATALYYEGWGAEDEDELISECNLTAEEAKKICDILKTYE